MESVSCALCGKDDLIPVLESKDYRFKASSQVFCLVQCDNCGLVYVNPRPTREEIGKFYPDEGYYQENESLANKYNRLLRNSKVRKIEKFSKKGNILDIGCGNGDFLSAMEARGWHSYGTDVSLNACQLASKKLQNIYNCELQECDFSDEIFDAITLNHVFEHFTKPKQEIEEIHRIIKPGGLLYLSLPNIKSRQFEITKGFWHHLEMPRHVYHFSPTTIRSFLEKNGFKVLSINFPIFEFPFDLARSLQVKWQYSGRRLKDLFYIAPFLKLSPKWRGTMEIIAYKVR